MLASRFEEYKLISAPQEDEYLPEAEPVFVLDVEHEQMCFSENAQSVTELIWSYNYYSIAVFDYGYFGEGSTYKGSGGEGEGGGGGYKVVSANKNAPAAPSPLQGAGGGGGG